MLCRLWHHVRLAELSAMYRSCIHEKKKEALLQKINDHKKWLDTHR